MKTEQKIIRFSSEFLPNYSGYNYKEITKLLKQGWKIKFSPSIIPAFAGYSPEIIFILEKEEE